MGKTFCDYGSIPRYFSILSDYSDFNTDLEEEADVNEEGNEDCSAVL